jgi:O-succinylbenzoic acid--CoA ligase
VSKTEKHLGFPCPLKLAAEAHPSQCAFCDEKNSYTFREAEKAVVERTLALRSLGLISGQRLALLAENSCEYFFLLLAAQRIGLSLVLLNLRHGKTQWSEQLALSGAELLVFGDKQLKAVTTLEIEKLSLSALLEKIDLTQKEAEQVNESNLEADAESCVVFTSGSTGSGKGVRISVAAHVLSARASNAKTGLTTGDSWLVSLPMFHVGGLEIAFRTVLAGACCHILGSNHDSDFVKRVCSTSANFISMVPSQLRELLSVPRGLAFARELKLILLGGAPSDRTLLEQIKREKLPVRTSYGMTETVSHVCMSDIGDTSTSGSVLDGIELRILDRQGRELDCGQRGEIVISSKRIFLGYLGEASVEPDAWFHTRDAGYLNAQGQLVVEGRIDRTIISGGENISLDYIERIVGQCGFVNDCAVLGINDEHWGERPLLFVQLQPGDDAGVVGLERYLETEIPKLFRPKQIIELESLPKTAIGKIDYKRLRDYNY